MNKLKLIFSIFILALIISSCGKDTDKMDSGELINPSGDGIYFCDGQWHCYENKGYARCNGALSSPKVEYDEVC